MDWISFRDVILVQEMIKKNSYTRNNFVVPLNHNTDCPSIYNNMSQFLNLIFMIFLILRVDYVFKIIVVYTMYILLIYK